MNNDSSDDDTIAAALIIAAVLQKRKKTRVRRKRSCWARTFYKDRNKYGINSIMRDLSVDQSSGQNNFLRMSESDFHFLLDRITPSIKKRDTHLRKSISSLERMAITLRFLSTGNSFNELSQLARVSPHSISYIVIDVCKALIEILSEEIQMPETPNGWKDIAEKFEKDTHFPHCIGALAGRHMVLQNSVHAYTSIVLMAMCDANYCFTYANIGAPGRVSDGGIFNNCSLAQKVDSGALNLPSEQPLSSQREKRIPYVIVADNAFAIKRNIMIPYTGFQNLERDSPAQIFNYRLSAARSRIDNTFGIMASVFRVLRKPILLQPEKVRIIVECCVLLHNFLRRSRTSQATYTPPGSFDTLVNGQHIEDGNWRNDPELTSCILLKSIGTRSCNSAEEIREEFANFFFNEGKVL